MHTISVLECGQRSRVVARFFHMNEFSNEVLIGFLWKTV